MRGRAPRYTAQAFRARRARGLARARRRARSLAEIGRLAGHPRRRREDGGGHRGGARRRDAAVPAEAARDTPETRARDAGEALRVAAASGDLHVALRLVRRRRHDRDMAEKARDLGHEYFALTDHSPRLKVANGLTPNGCASSSTSSPRSTRSWRRSASSPASRSTSSKTAPSTSDDDMLARGRRGRRERALEAAHGSRRR